MATTSPLRQRTIEDMSVRHFASKTQLIFDPTFGAELRQHAAQLHLIGTTCIVRPFRGTLFRNRRREAVPLVRQRSDRPLIWAVNHTAFIQQNAF
jgi:hypothetical protein